MKKLMLAMIALAVVAFGMSNVALAVNQDFWFQLKAGGDSDYSYATYKSDGEGNWYVTPIKSYNGHTSTWVNGSPVRFRVRFDDGRSAASDVYTRTSPQYGSTFSYPYFAGFGQAGVNYRLYADVPIDGSSCNLTGRWCP